MGYTEKLPSGRWKGTYRTPDGRERSKTFDRTIDAYKFWTTPAGDRAGPRRGRRGPRRVPGPHRHGGRHGPAARGGVRGHHRPSGLPATVGAGRAADEVPAAPDAVPRPAEDHGQPPDRAAARRRPGGGRRAPPALAGHDGRAGPVGPPRAPGVPGRDRPALRPH